MTRDTRCLSTDPARDSGANNSTLLSTDDYKDKLTLGGLIRCTKRAHGGVEADVSSTEGSPIPSGIFGGVGRRIFALQRAELKLC